MLRMQPIERHERDSTAVFLIHDFEDPGGGSVIVDDDVEETGKGKLGQNPGIARRTCSPR
jgi:hypothetical protein